MSRMAEEILWVRIRFLLLVVFFWCFLVGCFIFFFLLRDVSEVWGKRVPDISGIILKKYFHCFLLLVAG